MRPRTRKTLTPDSQTALINVRAMLGLDTATLNKSQNNGLLDRFHSFPAAYRQDGELLAARLEPVEVIFAAFGRSEVEDTMRKSPELQKLMLKLSAQAVKLAAA